MLVLSRRVGEQILIPHYGVTVTVVGMRGRTVRLGISAPPSATILRGELEPYRRPVLDIVTRPQEVVGESK